MSDLVIKLAIDGYKEELADIKKTIETFGGKITGKIEFPDTAYNLPLYFAFTGNKIETIVDAKNLVNEIENKYKNLDPAKVGLGEATGLGLDSILLEELKLAIESSAGEKVNFISDAVIRSLGVQLVSGEISGIAVVIGPAKDEDTAVSIIRAFQEKNILTVLAGNHEGKTMFEQLTAKNVEMTLNTYIVNLGNTTESVVLALNFAIRAALTFGGIAGGQKTQFLEYCAKRVPAFALALSGIDAKKVITAVGAIAMGFPVVCNFEVPKIAVKDEKGFEQELLTFETDNSKLIDKCVEVRNIKVKITSIPIPVKYGAAFEGERVRKEDLSVEFGGKGSTGLELLFSKDIKELENKKITVIGKEIDDCREGDKLDLALIVRVAGKSMQKDFEPILERQIHRFVNGAMGIMHVGQRNLVWIRINKNAKAAGFKFRHLGELLYAKILDEFGKLVDKVEVDVITDSAEVKKYNDVANKIYAERDKRIGEMTDESVDIFYSCLLCQSFAPNHVCIITPERLGLCGAYNWLDGKAAYEINPTGANQPISKGAVIDANLGQWQGINEFVFKASNNSVEKFSAYSILVDPMTSCGCFECIIAILPGTCGVMVVDRSFEGMTPSGMTFSSLAGVVGGGRQSPGFIGVGINYLTSKKFISAEGGLNRLVWMPSHLKERLKERLTERFNAIGAPDLMDKIADETTAVEMEDLMKFLSEKNHPALGMGEMF